jgi:cystathionine beta-lyase/cystathionine gamma-synthase
MTPSFGMSTRGIHAGEAPDPATGAHGVPIYQNAAFAFRSYAGVEAWRAGAPHYLYARDGNPTVRCLELKLANLEGTEDAVATGTGMAAISATLLHLLAGGGHLVASGDVYAVTKELLLRDLPAFGATVTLADFTDPAAVAATITPRTRALFCEPFSNPLLKVADLPALAEQAADRGIPLVVDNTFLSPALLRPIEHGATLVVHSATKYLSGHGNALGGIVCGPKSMVTEIRGLLSRLGGTMDAFSAWVLLHGVKTMPLRVERHSANALALAKMLASDPAVAALHYPGLETDPGHELAPARRRSVWRHARLRARRRRGSHRPLPRRPAAADDRRQPRRRQHPDLAARRERHAAALGRAGGSRRPGGRFRQRAGRGERGQLPLSSPRPVTAPAPNRRQASPPRG